MTDTTAGQLFRDGRLDEAVEAAGRAVARAPSEIGARMLFAELLLFTGDFERADTALAAAEAVDPAGALVVAEFRQLLRAASARRQLAADGRLPAFLGAPTQAQTHTLEALVALRGGDHEAAGRAAASAEAARPAAPGTGNGVAFADFRDADDLCSGSFEVLTTTGIYYWIPTERVLSADFHPPKRPRDLFWRRCTMSVREGPEGDVYIPVLYETAAALEDGLRLGRGTDWSDADPVRGVGQRTFLAGDEAMPVTALESLEFA